MPLTTCWEGIRVGSQSEDLPFIKAVHSRGLECLRENIINFYGVIMKKVCARCGMTFSCTDNQSEVTRAFSRLDARQRDYIAENYDNCLCCDCVQEIGKFFYAFGVNPYYSKKRKILSDID